MAGSPPDKHTVGIWIQIRRVGIGVGGQLAHRPVDHRAAPACQESLVGTKTILRLYRIAAVSRRHKPAGLFLAVPETVPPGNRHLGVE
jgi:hypothetical protein